jgi:D-tyrosyl-tRNA(Tyr) deacylase
MRLVLQRVDRGSVKVADDETASIRLGLVILVGVGRGDRKEDAEWLAAKVAGLRIFGDEQGKFNRSLLDVNGEALVVSQFTLYADASKGRRPSFTAAAPPEVAEPLVDHFARCLSDAGIATRLGRFGAHMKVGLVNDGPVTLVLERSNRGG